MHNITELQKLRNVKTTAKRKKKKKEIKTSELKENSG